MPRRFALPLLLSLVCPGPSGYPADEDGKRPAEAPAKLTPALKALARQLTHRVSANRLKAAQRIEELAEEGKPLARHLCAATSDLSPAVAKAALHALGKVHPGLHSPVAVLALEKEPTKQLAALQQIAALDREGAPAAPVLVAYLKKIAVNKRLPGATRQGLLRAGIATAATVAPKDREVVSLLVSFARSGGRNLALRGVAIETLGNLALTDPAIRKQVFPVVAAAVRTPQLRAVGVEAAGKLGADAKALLPVLRDLARGRDPALKKLAGEAVECITDPHANPQVNAALRWLVKNQQRDGSWLTGMGNNRPALVVTTSFCALALMAAGDRYREEVGRAAEFVAQNLFRDPPVARLIPANLDQSNWKVGIGGLFLCEYHAALKDKKKSALTLKLLEQVVEEAGKRVEPSGGWGHTPRLKNPLGYVELEVMSNWMLATLGAAQKLGVKVPAGKLKQPLQFIEDCCAADKGGVGYSPRAGQKGFGCPCRTGGAIFAFALLGQQKHPLYRRMVDSWKAEMGASGGGHGSVALGLVSSALAARQVGGEEWKAFQKKFFPRIEGNANPDGSFKHLVGDTPQSAGGADDKVGKAYNTAIFLLVLQLDRGKLKFLGQKHG